MLQLLFIEIFLKVSLLQVIDVFVGPFLKPRQQLFFNRRLKPSSDQSLAFALCFSLFVAFVYADDLLLGVHAADFKLALSDKHLVQFCKSLLALMALKLGPEL